MVKFAVLARTKENNKTSTAAEIIMKKKSKRSATGKVGISDISLVSVDLIFT